MSHIIIPSDKLIEYCNYTLRQERRRLNLLDEEDIQDTINKSKKKITWWNSFCTGERRQNGIALTREEAIERLTKNSWNLFPRNKHLETKAVAIANRLKYAARYGDPVYVSTEDFEYLYTWDVKEGE